MRRAMPPWWPRAVPPWVAQGFSPGRIVPPLVAQGFSPGRSALFPPQITQLLSRKHIRSAERILCEAAHQPLSHRILHDVPHAPFCGFITSEHMVVVALLPQVLTRSLAVVPASELLETSHEPPQV